MLPIEISNMRPHVVDLTGETSDDDEQTEFFRKKRNKLQHHSRQLASDIDNNNNNFGIGMGLDLDSGFASSDANANANANANGIDFDFDETSTGEEDELPLLEHAFKERYNTSVLETVGGCVVAYTGTGTGMVWDMEVSSSVLFCCVEVGWGGCCDGRWTVHTIQNNVVGAVWLSESNQHWR